MVVHRGTQLLQTRALQLRRPLERTYHSFGRIIQDFDEKQLLAFAIIINCGLGHLERFGDVAQGTIFESLLLKEAGSGRQDSLFLADDLLFAAALLLDPGGNDLFNHRIQPPHPRRGHRNALALNYSKLAFFTSRKLDVKRQSSKRH